MAEAFGAAYDTFSYTGERRQLRGRMRGLATTELTGTLARAYATPGVASQRAKQKQVCHGPGGDQLAAHASARPA